MRTHDPTALAVIENLTEAVMVLDVHGCIRWASASARRYGLSPSAYVGRSATSQFHPDDASRFMTGLARAIANPGESVLVDSLALQPLNGRAVPVDTTVRYLPEVDGIRGVLLVIREVGERLAARDLRPYDRLDREPIQRTATPTEAESEEQLRQVVRLSHIGIFDHNHVTGEFYWSPEHRKMFGWGADEPVVFANPDGSGWRTWNLVHPDDRQRAAEAVRRAHDPAGDGLFDLEYRIVRRDGTMRWIASHGQTFFEGVGAARRPVRTVGAVHDITEQKLAQRQLQITQSAVDKCNIAIFWINPAGQVTYANERACQSLGLTYEALVGRSIWDFDPDFRREDWPSIWQRTRQEGTLSAQSRHRRSDGTIFPIEVVASYFNYEGEEHFFVFAQDTTERERAERERRLMHAAIEKSHTPFYAIAPSGRIVYANEHASLMLGIPREELVGRCTWDIDPGMDPTKQDEYWRAIKARRMLSFETTHRRADGTLVPVEVTPNFFSHKGEEFSLAFVTDITERKRANDALRNSERRLREAQAIAHIGNWEFDLVTGRLTWSEEVYRLFGFELGSVVTPQAFVERIHPDDRERLQAAYQAAIRDGTPYHITYRVVTPDGGVRHLESRAYTDFSPEGKPLLTRGTTQDVTSRVLAEEALRHSLREKETLLREVHHRVKNNLQIIASLLHFQAKKVKSPEDLATFMDGRNRLRAMILVHEKLYQSEDLSRVDFGSYMRSLARDLQRSYSAGRNVQLEVSAEPLSLPIECALPCGMILCELLTNIFKYAFPDGRAGRASISIGADGDRVRLCVSDNGVGLPGHFDPDRSSSFGWQLIRNLAAQLGGHLSIGRDGGTHVTLSFLRPPERG